jgi:cell wall-associated NlpC family hydrolase
MPYVWGGDGPTTFDCSGLVQWSMTQAGIVMPRVAADQARDIGAVRLSAPTTMFALQWNPDAITRAMETVANEVIAKIN